MKSAAVFFALFAVFSIPAAFAATTPNDGSVLPFPPTTQRESCVAPEIEALIEAKKSCLTALFHLPFRATCSLTKVQLKIDTLWTDGVVTP